MGVQRRVKLDFYRNHRISVTILVAGLFIQVWLHGLAAGYTGSEINIKLNNAQFVPLNGTSNYQIKVNVNYTVNEPSLIGKKINAVMKVHSSDGSILKTTSFPSGFTVNKTGMTQLLTNIPISSSQNITTESLFTDLNKTNILSNQIETVPQISQSRVVNSSDFTPTVVANKT
jgi:hypothetical protein